MTELTQCVELWAIDRNLHTADPFKQLAKVIEEVGETAAAMCRNKPDDIKDGIGDGIVTLIILAMQHGLTTEECLAAAWDEIKDRKGKMINGTFIKEEDLDTAE